MLRDYGYFGVKVTDNDYKYGNRKTDEKFCLNVKEEKENIKI